MCFSKKNKNPRVYLKNNLSRMRTNLDVNVEMKEEKTLFHVEEVVPVLLLDGGL